MKNFKILVLMIAVLLVASPAFAFQCQTGRDIEGSSDSCWTSVKVASNETTLVSQGTVLVFDIANAERDADNGAFQVRTTTSTAASAYVAGVAQSSITSGSTALVLVRGKGKIKVQGAVTSGNALFVSSTAGRAATTGGETQYKPVAFALANGTTTDVDAYITVV